MTLPEQLGVCKGTYLMTENHTGVWSIACNNGMSASGTLIAYGSGKGSSGEGLDEDGNPVKFTMGGR